MNSGSEITNWKNQLIRIGESQSGIISLISTSEGMQTLAVKHIVLAAKRASRHIIHFDAHLHGSTPQLLFHNVFGIPFQDVNTDVNSDALARMSEAMIVVEHAEDLLALNRFKLCHSIFNWLQCLSKRWHCAFVSIWQSRNLISEDLGHHTRIQLGPLNPSDCLEVAESHRLSLSLESAVYFCECSRGFLEYLPAFMEFENTLEGTRVRSLPIETVRDHLALLADKECKMKWFRILLLARGYSSLKAVMLALAVLEQRRLTDIATYIGTSLQATREFLHELIHIGVIMRDNREYQLEDTIFEAWIRRVIANPDTLNPDIAHQINPRSKCIRTHDHFLEID